MSPSTVAIVHLGRTGGMGALRRVASLTAVLELAGAEVVDVPLRVDHRARLADLARLPVGPLLRSAIVPEALAWSRRSALAELARIGPDVVICETSRAFDPAFASGPWHLVLDFVDRLSVSYRDRSTIVTSLPRRVLFQTLGATARRFEDRLLPPGVGSIAAGWADAEALGADWLPITFDAAAVDPPDGAHHDLLFFGNLSYPPNVEAVDRLASLWPAMIRHRPGTTLLLAGASPTDAVRDAARRHGWEVRADFADLDTILGAARLGVVPLVHASGIQTKVLEAAAFGLAQVVDPVALAGMAPGFPAEQAAGDDAMIAAIARLLDDDDDRRALGRAAREHMAARYSAAAWEPWAAALIGTAAP